MADTCSQGGEHKDYIDRKVTIDGKKYKVRRCKKCGREVYELIK